MMERFELSLLQLIQLNMINWLKERAGCEYASEVSSVPYRIILTRVSRVQARGRLGEIVAPVVSRVALGNPEGDKNFALHFL